VFLHGGPVWSSAHGHHVVVNVDDVQYRFASNNPIPNWLHLTTTRRGLRNYLVEADLPPSHAQAIADYVYRNPGLNRLVVDKLERILRRSPFEAVEIERAGWNRVPPPMARRLKWRSRYRSRDYLTYAVNFIARKAA
jgi:hypothetical protein